MVWIHGGAFSFGSANFYVGGILATFNDVIFVTLNYRLGVLGFFNVPGTDVKENYGMLDQVAYLTVNSSVFRTNLVIISSKRTCSVNRLS